LGSVDPRVARESFLDSLTTDEQLRVLRQAEKIGPMPDDSDSTRCCGSRDFVRLSKAPVIRRTIARFVNALLDLELDDQRRRRVAEMIRVLGVDDDDAYLIEKVA